MTARRTTKAKLLQALLTPRKRCMPPFKALLCKNIRSGDLTFERVKLAHKLSAEELTSWCLGYEEKGTKGLRVSGINRRRAT
jgi:hypothetical protein